MHWTFLPEDERSGLLPKTLSAHMCACVEGEFTYILLTSCNIINWHFCYCGCVSPFMLLLLSFSLLYAQTLASEKRKVCCLRAPRGALPLTWGSVQLCVLIWGRTSWHPKPASTAADSTWQKGYILRILWQLFCEAATAELQYRWSFIWGCLDPDLSFGSVWREIAFKIRKYFGFKAIQTLLH